MFMQKNIRKKFGEILIDAGIATTEQIHNALLIQKQKGQKIGQILVAQKLITQEQMLKVLEFQLGIPYVLLDRFEINPEAVKKINENLAKRHELIPIQIENEQLVVAMSDPLNIYAIDDVRIYSGMEVKPVIAGNHEILQAIDLYYGKNEAFRAAEAYKKELEINFQEQDSEETVDELVNSAPIVKLVNTIIEQAARMKASDVHIEPFEKHIRIRFRVDGQLQETMRHEIQLLAAIVTRIKIMSGLDIAEKRKPQDGRISTTIDHNEYDLRVSTLPTVYGEKAVIRVIDKNSFSKEKESLGFFKEDLEKFDQVIKSSHGMILVTGPTGSGKSTTLYTALREMNRNNINIVTVEDPVEVTIEGINQVQVNQKAGLNFSSALRSILRQDPDIVMIGEIRDAETAEIAIRAAITGHLVVSTLHTNDAPGAIARLVDMGIEPFLLGTSVVGIIAQRLIRKLCPSCKTEYIPRDKELELLKLQNSEEYGIYRANGCHLCHHTGYLGRIGIYEIMPVSQEMRQLIHAGANTDQLRNQAIREGMSTLKETCIRHVLNGTTTIEELIRVVFTID